MHKLSFLLLGMCLTLSVATSQTLKKNPDINSLQIKPLTDDKYDNATDFSEGLAAVKVNGKWGFIDRTGNMVITPQFNPFQQQFNSFFSEGLVAVNMANGKVANKETNDPSGTRWGFADKTGKIVIPTKFEGDYYHPPRFVGGLAVIGGNFIGTTVATFGLHVKYGYIDKTGNLAIPQKFDAAYDFSDELACVKIGEKYGFIDRTGKMVIDAIYDSPGYFKDGIAVVGLNNINVAIDKKNKKVLDKNLQGLSQFYEGLARFDENYKIGFIDLKGNVKIKPSFEAGTNQSAAMMYFSEGLSPFEDGSTAPRNKDGTFHGKFGYINTDGKVVIAAQFNYAGPFKNGIAIVSMGGNYGYINRSGKFLIQPIYANAGYFTDGIARVSGGGSFGDYKFRFIKAN